MQRAVSPGHLAFRGIVPEIVLHRTDPEAAVRADFAFVETVVRPIVFGLRKSLERAAKIPKRDAARETYNGAAIVTKSDRGHEFRGGPGFVMAVRRIKPMNSLVADIDPDKALTSGVPHHAFAGVVLAVEYDPDVVVGGSQGRFL